MEKSPSNRKHVSLYHCSREAEKAEIERRRELTEEERVKEDMAYLAKKAKEEQALKSSGTVEKYHHKGAFFMVSFIIIL